jgi:hypothetical protein
MGYFLIFENMLPSVLAVRDNCLAEGGQIIPYEASLHIFGYSGEYKDAEQDSMDMDQGSSREAVVALLEEKNMITNCAELMTIDLRTVKDYKNEFKSVVTLTVLREEELYGVCAFFNCKLTPGSSLNTSPSCEPTHWKQTIFPLK